MEVNQPPWPREWLMTDERIGGRLRQAIEALPSGAGIVFRHYATPEGERTRLAQSLAQHCLDRRLTLAIARDVELAKRLGARLVHNPASDPCGMPFSRAAHSAEEALSACGSGAALLFVGPVFPTRSHPGRPSLGHAKAVQIARLCNAPVIALGGVNRANFAVLRHEGFYGWAGIDAWLP